MGISYKEARESVYWLRVLKELYEEEIHQKKFEEFINEGIELRKILATIKKKSSNNP
ncbi:MAG: four helix bundle protein [Bacteroidia bacterium]|nr:four helix bundle protein [Bacteroidia bacterium]